jgi:hypothetical protein
MSAPTPWNGPLPILFTGSFQKRQFGVGSAYVTTWIQTPGSLTGGTVFDNLVNPPAGGVTAEAVSLTFAQAVGVLDLTWNAKGTDVTGSVTQTNGKPWYTPAIVAKMIKKNFDFVMIFYLENSIVRSGGVPVV